MRRRRSWITPKSNCGAWSADRVCRNTSGLHGQAMAFIEISQRRSALPGSRE
jgi:hypothetical protein